jgi:hypothetical protein
MQKVSSGKAKRQLLKTCFLKSGRIGASPRTPIPFLQKMAFGGCGKAKRNNEKLMGIINITNTWRLPKQAFFKKRGVGVRGEALFSWGLRPQTPTIFHTVFSSLGCCHS